MNLCSGKGKRETKHAVASCVCKNKKCVEILSPQAFCGSVIIHALPVTRIGLPCFNNYSNKNATYMVKQKCLSNTMRLEGHVPLRITSD